MNRYSHLKSDHSDRSPRSRAEQHLLPFGPPSIPTTLTFVVFSSLLFFIFHPVGTPLNSPWLASSHFEFHMEFMVIFLYNFYWILGICLWEGLLTLSPWLVLNTHSSCINLWSADIIGRYHLYQLSILFLMTFSVKDIVLESNKLSWIPISYSNITLWSVCMHVCRHMYVRQCAGQRSALVVAP